MYSRGEVIFKSIQKRDKGTFTNEKGQNVEYDSSYVINIDEKSRNGINQRKLKFPTSNKVLYDKFEKLQEYTKIILVCDVEFTQSGCRLVPIDVLLPEEEEEEN